MAESTEDDYNDTVRLHLAPALSAAPHVVAKEGRTLTLDQAKTLLAEVAGHRFEVAIMIAPAYGLRRGEVLACTGQR
ncbi:hypothetical protein SAMN04489712_12484 [Thermomonospora echinospora]|uniref:Uncharacterized protein n=1 Tax=Thermomonospora echinospora TaxID=1992 RepID=A0A1H6DWX7_9ACTN|nr:hypothetical protein [Thermomonospora echinospora]SEG89837.1 hypothetical protein SAMN04489712_12484 [Thermomonospora echinospora]